jgi:hypothetical protein
MNSHNHLIGKFMANTNLTDAKRAKFDEFYTQYRYIEKEISAYLEYSPDVFNGKTVLLPCDDPEWSNFTKYFAQNFEKFGLKKLISTSYAVESKTYKNGYQPTIFETSNPQYDENKTTKNGKIFTLTCDRTGDRKIDVDDLEWHYLKGDGDFRSSEIVKLRDEADIIITNPPFSLFREFLAWIVKAGKHFSIIANMNAITYKEVFPLIKENKIWLGATNFNTGMYFKVPSNFVYADSYKFEREQNGEKVNRVPGVCWLTNIDHGKRHQPLPLMTMADNLRYSKHKEIKGKKAYDVYDNYDAIEVPFTDAIPSDYDGVMGVPISFLDKYSPEQFEILGLSRYTKTQGMSKEFVDAYYKSGQTGTISEGHPDLCFYDHNNRPVVPYMRVLIKLR